MTIDVVRYSNDAPALNHEDRFVEFVGQYAVERYPLPPIFWFSVDKKKRSKY